MSPTIAAAATILTAVFASVLAVNLRRGRDPFSPWCLVPGLHLLRTSPFLFLAAFDPDFYVHPAIVDAFPDLDSAFLWYGFVELVGFGACLMGIGSRLGVAIGSRLPLLTYRVSLATLELCAGIATAIGFLAFLLLLRNIGGLNELVNSLDMRVTLLEGMGPYLTVMPLAAVGCILLAYSLKLRFSGGRLIVVCGLAVLTAAMFSTTGGRKNALGLLVSLLIIWHWCVRPIRHPVRLAAIVSLLIAPYFVAMPLLRGSRNAVSYYAERPADLMNDIVSNSSVFIRQLSYCETYLFVCNWFATDTVWMGATYRDLVKAPVPRRLLPDKPPTDEGQYIYNLAQGNLVYPGMPSRDQIAVGWPTETLGTMYWNFHLPGVLAGMFVLGVVMRAAYCYVVASSKSLYSLILYQTVMFGFALSNLRLIQFVSFACFLTLFFITFLGARAVRPLK